MKRQQENLLKRSGYSEKAIHYFLNKVHIGTLKDPDAYFAYTGPCGDTMEFYLVTPSKDPRPDKLRQLPIKNSVHGVYWMLFILTDKKLNR